MKSLSLLWLTRPNRDRRSCQSTFTFPISLVGFWYLLICFIFCFKDVIFFEIIWFGLCWCYMQNGRLHESSLELHCLCCVLLQQDTLLALVLFQVRWYHIMFMFFPSILVCLVLVSYYGSLWSLWFSSFCCDAVDGWCARKFNQGALIIVPISFLASTNSLLFMVPDTAGVEFQRTSLLWLPPRDSLMLFYKSWLFSSSPFSLYIWSCSGHGYW